jgi:hypothetical protein
MNESRPFDRTDRRPRPLIVPFLGALDVAAGFLAVPAIIVLESVAPSIVLLPGMAGVFGGLCWGAALAVWRMTPRGRTLQLIVCWIGLVLAPPVSTLVFLPVLLLMRQSGARILFSGRPPGDLSEAETLEVDRFIRRTTRYLSVPLAGMALLWVGASALVSLLELNWQRFDQAITVNEERTLRDIRTLSAAEQAYAGTNHGYYDLPLRLRYSPPLLSGPSEGRWSGYVRRFHPGPPPDGETIEHAVVSPSSLRSFAYVARPLDPGTTGRRTFCVDATGLIRFTLEERLPDPVDGVCPRTMLFLP